MSELQGNAPPPYSASGLSGVSANDQTGKTDPYPQQATQQPIVNPNSTTYHLRSHVLSLPSRIRASNTTRANKNATGDSALLEQVLVPHVEDFLAELGEYSEAPPSATLVLYPSAALASGDSAGTTGTPSHERKKPILSGLDDMQRNGEFVRIQGVEPLPPVVKTDLSDKKVSSFSHTLPSRKADLLWWKDEAMARRLAGYIQPKHEDSNQPPPAFFDADTARQEQLRDESANSKNQKKSWGFKKLLGGGRSQDKILMPQPGPPQQARGYADHSVDASELNQQAKMVVKAEEMTFRVENDMGLFESFNGWALVARVDLTRT